MNLSNLPKIGEKNKKRVGRGIGSGTGKTSGRGMKGQNSRSGGGVRLGFEGGQNPLTKRVPQLKGFKSRNPKNQVVSLNDLNQFTGKVTKEKLFEKGIIENIKLPVKVLATGKLEKVVEVSVEHVSKEAEKEIVKKGGKVTILVKPKQVKKQYNKEAE
ncbi:MAG: 50S ribosomal protein L15 [bacterium]|nr:50S ribosomal protein L15 [bacterium]